jgi:hypothetical protein
MVNIEASKLVHNSEDPHRVIVGAGLDDDKGHELGSTYVYPVIFVGIGADHESIFLNGEGAAPVSLSWKQMGLRPTRRPNCIS